MKPFNLEKALAGEPVITRNGRRVLRIAHFPECGEHDRVVAAIEGEGDVYTFYENGNFVNEENEIDLFMAPNIVKYYFASRPFKPNEYVQLGMKRLTTCMFEKKDDCIHHVENSTSNPDEFTYHEIEIDE